jgi:hypothetical protein
MSGITLSMSGIMDEAARQPSSPLSEQCACAEAARLPLITLRNLDVGTGRKNIGDLNDLEARKVPKILEPYKLGVACVASPLLKTKLVDGEDGTQNAFVPTPEILESARRLCGIAKMTKARTVRIFSGYVPRGSDPSDHKQASIDLLGQVGDIFQSEQVVVVVENEVGLAGWNGESLAEILSAVGSDYVGAALDLANLQVLGYDLAGTFDQARMLVDGGHVLVVHVKTYDDNRRRREVSPFIDEGSLRDFVLSSHQDGEGTTPTYVSLMRYLRGAWLSTVQPRLRKCELQTLICDMEPHVESGGQFGGGSGALGMRLAVDAFESVCKEATVVCPIRDFSEILAKREVK